MSKQATRILIVDDEPAHVEAIRRALLSDNPLTQVRTADSLGGYHQAVAAHAPDLVLLDFLLPDGQADSVLVSPPEAGAFPIVVMTSHGDEQVAVTAMKSGALDYVVKSPEAFAEMPHTLERTRRAWQVLQERRRALEALRESELRQRAVLANIPDPAWMKDLNGRFLAVNKAWCDLVGVTLEQALAHTDSELFSPEVGHHFREQELRVVAEGKGSCWEEKFPDAKGQEHDFETFKAPVVDSAGKAYATIGIARDVTERKQTEWALSDSEERLRMALEASQMGTFDDDLVQGRISWSRRHEELWGLAPGQFEGTYEAFLRQVHPDDRAGIQAEWDRCVSTRATFQHEYRVIHPDGSQHWVESAGRFTFDEAGRPIRLRGTVVEVSQRRQAEHFRLLSAEILRLLDQEKAWAETTQGILDAIKRETGFDAVGIRLREGEDYPYQGSSGFSVDFLAVENSLLPRTREGGLCRDKDGHVPLECTCGLIISGKTDPNNSLFTPGGSAWTNDAGSFLHVPASQDPRLNPRNRCIHEGFQSVALIPIRVEQEIIGLLQLNDRRKGCFTLQMIEFFEGLASSFGVALLRRKKELELSESEQNLRSLFDVVAESVFLMDREGVVLAANKTFASRLGRMTEECVGRSVFDFLTPEVAKRRRAWIAEAIRLGRPVSFEDERDGRCLRHNVYPIVDEGGTVKRLVIFAVDVTQSRQANEQLRQLSRAVEQSPASIVITDPRGEITYVNPRFVETSGYTLEEVRSQNPRMLRSGEMPATLYQELWRTITGGEEWRGELRNKKKSGELHWELVSISPIKDVSGQITHFVAVKEDITERKRLESFREALLALGDRLNNTRRAVDAGRALLHAADRLWQWDAAIFTLLSEDQRESQSLLSVDTIEGERQEVPTETTGPLTPRLQRVVREGAFLILRDSRSPAATDSVPFGDTGRLSACIMCVPIRREMKILGVLSIQSYMPNAYTQRDLQTLQALADYCGGALERIRSEESLSRSEARYRDLVETAFDWVWEMDAQGRYVYASSRIRDILGYTPEEVLGRTPFDLMPETEAERVRLIFGQIAAKQEPFASLENTNRHKDGRLVVLETSGVPVFGPEGECVGYRGMDRDVTERRRAEEALRRSEADLREAQRVAKVGNWSLDVATGEVAWSEELYRIFGLERSKFSGTHERFLELVHPEDRPRVVEANREARVDGRSFEVEYRVVTPAGTERVVREMGYARKDAQGRIIGLFGTAQDVTDQMRLESQLRQVQKLDAIGQLAGGVAHDFNNILAAIMMQLGLLGMSARLDETTRHAVKELDAEARRAASLTRQLLMFSRRSVLAVKPLDLNEIMTNLLKMLGRLIGEQIGLRFHDKTGLPLVSADAGMMEQVLMNLVVNARDAMPRGGRITITTSVLEWDEEGVARNPVRRPGRYVCLAVADTGTGIDDATLKRIFEPFFTTKEPGKGTGLGLATVHGIVAQHKGWVEVESEVGHGTTFRVLLPALAGADVPSARTGVAGQLQGGRETVLLVEDDAKARRMIGQALRVLGYRVYEAANGQQAITVWQEHGAQVDLLLTDMVMPEGMTGLELAERLQALRPGLRVIISSGYSAEMVQAGVPDKAGISYLPKPYEVQKLAEVVRSCLDRKM